MKKGFKVGIRFAFLILSIGYLVLSVSFKQNTVDSFDNTFKNYFSEHAKVLLNRILVLFKSVDAKNFNPDSSKIFLANARTEYKAIEPYVIYFLPGDARRLNKPIIAEMEEDDELGAYVVPHGFQYLEMLLYSDSAFFYRKKIKEEVENIYSLVGRFNESISYAEINERDVFESIQLHLVRQFVLGLANFETAESRRGVPESSATLIYYKEFLLKCLPQNDSVLNKTFFELFDAINYAVSFLNSVKPNNEPDYFTFYSLHYIPISEKLETVRQRFVQKNIYNTTAVNFQVRSIFDPYAYNSYFFLPAKKINSTKDVIELGRTLFFDPALSANNLRACASCHQPGKAFTDGLPLSQSFEPGKSLGRNAPTVVNSVLQRKLFHDGRAFTFEDQAGQVMSNPLEMHNDFSQVAVKLKTSPQYVNWFRIAFSSTADSLISSHSILTAIAEYERSLIGMNSPFDKTISGRERLMNEDEKAGFNLYMGKANCASCHFLPLFNGVMPPEYVETEWEIIGVPSSKRTSKPELDPDQGRAGVLNDDIFRHAFKVPTLRNIELTGPYMHNGVFKSLEEVIEFYDIGGGTNLGYDVPFQTLSSDSLHLTQLEKFQLISFLKTLTDTINLTSVPGSLPFFPDNPLLNKRPIGGDY